MNIRREFVVQVVGVGEDADVRGLAVTVAGHIEDKRRNHFILLPLGEETEPAALLAVRDLGARLYRNVKLTVLIEDVEQPTGGQGKEGSRG